MQNTRTDYSPSGLICRLCTLFVVIFLSLAGNASFATTQSFNLSELQAHQGIQVAPFSEVIQPETNFVQPEKVASLNGWVLTKKANLDNFSGPIWSRFKLTNPTDEDQDLLLIQENPQIRDITLFEKTSTGFENLHQVGEKYPFNERPLPHRLFLMPVTVKAHSTAEFYLHSSVAAFDNTHRLYLWDRQGFFESVRFMDIWELFYFGVIFVMVCYNLVIYSMTKDKSYLYYSVFVSGTLILFLCITGWGFQLFWPQITFLNQRLSYTGMAIMFSFAGWFSIEFLSLRKHFPMMAAILNALCILCISILMVYLVTPFDDSYLLVRALSMISIPVYTLCWVSGIMIWMKVKDTPSKIYTGAWSVLIFVTVLTLAHEAIFPIFDFSIFFMVQISHGIEVVALSMALANRITQLKINESFANAKADSKSKFLARMSHEIRTPMNGILGISDLLSKRLTDKTNKHYIDIIHGSATALEKIINDILDYSKVEAGKLQLENKPFSVTQLVKDICDMFELECADKGLTLTSKIHQNVAPYYLGDVNRIRQLLINLVGNAIKYTEEGSVTIKVTDNKQLKFEVVDTGIGIAMEDQPRLFDPFEQAVSNNLGRDSSTGLGLAICAELASLMNGSIQVQSRLGHGSNFSLILPLPITQDPNEPAKTQQDEPIVHLNFNRILVAEDNQVNKTVISSILANLGVSCHIADNGLETLEYYHAHANEVDVILMDCEMPVMDGFEATRAIRAFEEANKLPSTPIIALTAHTWHQELQQCYQAGMDDLLLKPITKASVRKTLALYQPNTDGASLEGEKRIATEMPQNPSGNT